MLRHLALICNFLCPGIGSLMLGKWLSGLAQLAMVGGGIVLLTHSLYGLWSVLLLIAAWGWGLATAEWSPRSGGVAARKRT